MFRDYGGFGQDYWRGVDVEKRHEAGYSNFNRNSYNVEGFADDIIHEMEDPATNNVLIIGCALGYTVEELRSRNIAAYGLDYSQWAVENAVDENVYQGDVREIEDLKWVADKTRMGEFDLVCGERFYSCLTDEEAKAAVTNMREVGVKMMHRVFNPRKENPYYNWKPVAKWMTMLDPDKEDEWYARD